MSTTHKKAPSAIVQTVLDLDETFEEMKRLCKRIENLEIRGDSDYEHLREFMTRYAESAQTIATHVNAFSHALNDARANAEASAQMVASRAELLQAHHNERQKKTEAFQILSQKVSALTLSLKDLNRGTSDSKNDADRLEISARLKELDTQIKPLIEEAQTIRQQAQIAKMTALEQEANSLRQSLIEVSKKLNPQ